MSDDATLDTTRKPFGAGLGRAFRRFIGGATDPDAPDEQGRTLLMHACFQLQRPVIEKLIEAGADLARVDAQGNTALHHVYLGEPNELKGCVCAMQVVRAGVDINAVNHEGQTALLLSLAHLVREGLSGYSIVTDFMVEQGADLRLTNPQGQSAESLILANPTLFSEELVGRLRAQLDQDRLETQTAPAIGTKPTFRL